MFAMRALSSRNTKTSNAASPRLPRSASDVRYDILDRVGEGTLFVVYRVRKKSSNRLLALKALKNNFNAHPQFAPALAQALAENAAFSHPLLARVEEVGREDGTLFQLQEWLPGQSLEARLRRAPFGRIETVSSTRQIAEALQYLHQNGAVHGDLRPRQIISSSEGHLKLTDYNLSQAFRAASLSPADVMQDAVAYTAPELSVATGQEAAPATQASDLYSLGVILYRMLAGRAPFEGASPVAVAMRHRNDAPLPPSRFNPHCPPDLEEIALRLLQKNPTARFDSASSLLETLGAAAPVISAPVATTSTAPVEPTAVNEAPSAQTQPLPVAQNDDVDDSSTRIAPLSNQDKTDNGAALFPATMPISAIANAPLSALNATANASAANASVANATTNAITMTSVVAPAVVAASVASLPVATSSAAAAPAAAVPSVAVPVAGTSSVTGAPTLPPTAEDLAADAALERKAIKKHRRREALGAFLAFFWIWVAVGLLGGIVYGAYNWWVKQTPPDVTVPSYIGKNENDVKTILEKAGLKFNEIGEVYDPKRPAGTVIRGFPAAGKIVKPGRPIDVTVSRGAEKVIMPDLSELDLVHVRQILQKAGMRLGNISTMYHDTIARGYICGQFPQPGDAFKRSEPINLVISRGPQPAANVNAASVPSQPSNAQNNTDNVTDNNSAADNGSNDNGSGDENNDQPPPISSQAQTNNAAAPGAPDANDTTGDSEPMVARTVRVSIPVPKKGGATTREVRVVVRDADGEHVVYDENHAPGEQIDEYVQITRAQGGSATILIYIDGTLQKQQRV